MARGWKRAVELMLARTGFAARRTIRDPGSVTILAYHNIVPHGEGVAGDVSLHVDQATFADQLDFILERHDVIGLLEAFTGDISDRPRVVITFDDAYQGAMTAGVEELTKRRLPATVFVPPGLLGAIGFWWDILAPSNGSPLSPMIRRHALTVFAGRAESILAWAEHQGIPRSTPPEHARPVEESSLSQQNVREVVTLGAHTWSHPNLAVIDSSELENELGASKDWLAARSGKKVDWLAYPYGLYNRTVVNVAKGRFDGSVLVSGGRAIRRGQTVGQLHETPRLNVPRGLSLEGLGLRLAGLME